MLAAQVHCAKCVRVCRNVTATTLPGEQAFQPRWREFAKRMAAWRALASPAR